VVNGTVNSTTPRRPVAVFRGSAGDDRSLDQLRADMVLDLLNGRQDLLDHLPGGGLVQHAHLVGDDPRLRQVDLTGAHRCV